jgi:dUTP pyrophosphatase
MKVQRIRDVKLPTRGTPLSAGLDFYVPNNVLFDDVGICLKPGDSVVIPSGIKVEVPKGYALIGFNKSGIAVKRHLYVGACVIDEDYQGEVHIHLTNVGKDVSYIFPGDKIAQFVLVPVLYADIEEVDELHKVPTERGTGAFGSTDRTDTNTTIREKVEMINERVAEKNEPQYKEGDFVINKRGDILIFKKKDENKIYDHAFFNDALGLSIAQMSPSYSPIRRHATEEEKQKILDTLTKEGKRWNAEKLCVEDIPVRKFNVGDRVRIKDGISSKTHCNIYPWFVEEMDELIGKTMTVDRYTDGGKYVVCEETESIFREEWLEPYEEQML